MKFLTVDFGGGLLASGVVISNNLEFLETLLGTMTLGDLQYVETNSLGQGTTFPNGNNIADFNISEAGRAVSAHVSVTFFETAVFTYKVQVITTEYNGTLHFSFTYGTS